MPSKSKKHSSPAEAIAWLDEKGNVKPLDPAPYDKSTELHEKHIQMLRNNYILLAMGVKDIRKWLKEIEDRLNGIEEEEVNANDETIETI